ncbi:hypothetical protein IQ255_09875 [Pleurocapsales cyanobacterium LEGE 10410]|nr:hypothetical protein [Pleurocapsales cyanobacterium LEGE 10410]
MNKPITLNLPEDVYNRAEGLAQLIGRDLTDVLIEAISLSLSSTSPINDSDRHFSESLKSLSDREVMAMSELQMESEQDLRLSQLLSKQQADTLSEAERPELWGLMQIYQTLLVKKAVALREAVERGLREPLEARS